MLRAAAPERCAVHGVRVTTAHGRSAVAGSAGLTARVRTMPGRSSSWLSNGRYRTLIAAHGGGSSACGDVALTRSRADALSIDEGLMVFVRDLESGVYWTLGLALSADGGAPPEVRRESGRVEIKQSTALLDCTLAITVAAERDCELRRLELRNHSGRVRRLEVTTFCEVALLSFAADLSHPAFSRLFIETEFASETGALLAHRRPRGRGEVWPLMVHALSGAGGLEWESSRERFIGRGHEIRHPAALERPGALSGSTGRVLDPALCLRRTLTLAPDGEVTLTALLGAATDREQALELARTFATPERIHEAFERAAEQDQARGREHDLSAAQSAELESLAGALWCGAVRVMPPAEDESDLRDAGDRLGALGLKRDAVRVVADERGTSTPAETPRMIDRAARYWRSLGVAIECCALTRTGAPRGARRESGVFEFGDATLASEELDALLRTASLLVSGDEWPEPAGHPADETEAGEWDSSARAARQMETLAEPFSEPLADFNGYGGFNAAADEYVIRIRCDEQRRAHLPPRPWINVIANEHFGFLISESGAGCTWSGNSREHRLTPWANDPLLDPHGEALYLRDELTGAFWSPLPGPAPATGEYETRHGFGYSVCRHVSAGLEQQTCAFVPLHDPVKVVLLRVQNHGKRNRPLSLFGVQSLVLGDTRWRSARFIETRLGSGRDRSAGAQSRRR